MASEEWDPTPAEKLQEIVVWLGFLKRALERPRFEEGVLYLTGGDGPREPMPVQPSGGCGRGGLENVAVTLPEAAACVGDLHDLAVSLQSEQH